LTTTSSTSGTLSTTSLSGLGLTGLSSGLDTSGIITKLMAIESAPQTLLKTQLTTLQTHTTALQSLNTAVAAIATTAQAAVSANALLSFTATSSSTAATATASATASAGSLQFTVQQLAQTQLSVTGSMADTSTFASSDHIITIQPTGAAAVKITAASSSVDDMVKAINAAGAGVVATKVSTGTTGQYRIQLTAGTSGTAGGFAVYTGDSTDPSAKIGSGSSPTLTTVTAAQDAQVTLYPGSAAAFTKTSSTNTFTALNPGLDVTVSATTSSTDPVTVTVAADVTAASTSAQALTSGLITLFSGIASSTAISTTSSTSGGSSSSATTGGVFTGDTLVRSVKDSLLTAISQDTVNGVSTGKSPSSIGIALTKDGTITFDQSAFEAAMTSDPEGTTAMYQRLATAVLTAANAASTPSTGSISTQVISETSQQSDSSTKISDWDTRLAAIQAAYQVQFDNLETALSALSSQSSYITSQIAGLTTNYQTTS
jgi:flagellar hook-associated protein 2